MQATELLNIATAILITHQLFVIVLLLSRNDQRKDHSIAIAMFFFVNMLVSIPTGYSIAVGAPLPFQLESLQTPLLMLLGPALYMYCLALVSPNALTLRRKDLVHLAPFVAALLATILGQTLSLYDFSPDTQSPSPPINWATYVIIGSLLGVILGFLVVTSIYVIKIIRLLSQYRRGKFDYFSSLEGRNLSWFEWFIGLLVVVWTFYTALLIDDIFFRVLLIPEHAQKVIELAWVMSLSFMVLWQAAIYPQQQPALTATEDKPEQGTAQKYQRSAMDEERRNRIIGKIERAMTRDKIYRRPNLTLRALSDHTTVSENNVSQALNEHLGKNFYEFINHWRIKDAMQLLQETELSVIQVGDEVGFNSRSTFNAAFKKETGVTPSEFRVTAQEA